LPLFPSEKVMSQYADSKKNNANNKGSCCHGEPIYSFVLTVGKQKFDKFREKVLRHH
jgi:hypothetical protein